MAKCTGMRCPMQYVYKVDECNHTDCPYRTEPITNADRIRVMSDEELAKFLADEIAHGDCYGCNLECATFEGDKFDIPCHNAFYRWLKQPAE